MDTCDILCIQEHWALKYEAAKLADIFPHHNFLVKCVDDLAPDLPMMRRRGNAGTAMVWHKRMDSLVKPVTDGSDRINALLISDSPSPLLIINTYMPTMGCKDPTYSDTLDEVHELLSKYDSCNIIWTGDINADSNRKNGYDNDRLLIQFLQEHHLAVTDKQPDSPTYYHFTGSITSRLDLFIEKQHSPVIQTIINDTRHPLNTSPHDAVTATVTLQHAEAEVEESTGTSLARKRVHWDKVDLIKYNELTTDRLGVLSRNSADLPVGVTIELLNDVLTRSAAESSPPPAKKHKKKRAWNPLMKPMVKEIKSLHHKVKTEAKQCDREKLKGAKKALRKAQRQYTAMRRKENLRDILQACKEKDQREFFKMVKRQRRTVQPTGVVNFGPHKAATQQDSWASYFEDLASPKENDLFDKAHDRHLQTMHLLHMLNSVGHEIAPISPGEVQTYVGKLKNGKAPDYFGVSAEHLKNAPPMLCNILCNICNVVLSTGRIPIPFKLGLLNPCLKKDRNHKEPNNYRRITISSLIGKVVETHLLIVSNKALGPRQNCLQFGFTEDVSPMFAAVILTEAMAEAKDKSTPLYLTFMDSSKAFDVVNHQAMLHSLQEQGIQGRLWNVFCSMYEDITSVVKWDGKLSRTFEEKQGIRQGGVTSPLLYKAERNKGLSQLQKNPSMYIGTINVGAVMVADDLALVSSSVMEMQAALLIAETDAAREKYTYNVDKTKTLAINASAAQDFVLNGKPLGNSTCEKHLGIKRNSLNSNSDTIEARITDARRTAYSLMGAGLCGLNGCGPEAAIRLYTTYVLPVLLYGLEALVLQDKELSILEHFHRRNLRHILHLPASTASPAVYLLSGCAPLEAQIHIRVLTMFRNIVDVNPESPPSRHIHSLISRQVAMKDSTSSSWAAMVRRLLHHYDLPTAYTLLQSPPRKTTWKTMVRTAILDHWTGVLREQAGEMSSLEYVNLDVLRLGTLHASLQCDPKDFTVQKITVATKLLVRRYPLASSHASGKKSLQCPLCKKEEVEDETHFILQCSALREARAPFLAKLLRHCRENNLSVDPPDLTRWILDPYGSSMPHHICEMSRTLLFKIHLKRTQLLAKPSQTQDLPVTHTSHAPTSGSPTKRRYLR